MSCSFALCLGLAIKETVYSGCHLISVYLILALYSVLSETLISLWNKGQFSQIRILLNSNIHCFHFMVEWFRFRGRAELFHRGRLQTSPDAAFPNHSWNKVVHMLFHPKFSNAFLCLFKPWTSPGLVSWTNIQKQNLTTSLCNFI